MWSPVVLGVASALLLVVQVNAFRSRPKKQVAARSGDGQVDLLYTYGTPATGKPAIKHPTRSDGCFPGLRFWNTNHGAGLFNGDQVDIVAPLANIVGYRHAYMDGMELEIGEGKYYRHSCSEENTGGPSGLVKAYLHASATYIEEASKIDQLALNISKIGVRVSYMQDEQEAARHVNSFGWGLVHTAYHPGSIVGGPQVAHLLQDPDSLTCIVTFQGTDSIQDALQDVNAISVNFCGLEGQVHQGFRNHLRRIVKSDVFQDRIRPYLPGCAKVIAVGHSLGGAMAELFAACMASAPASGTPGWKSDFQYFTWKQGRSSRLPYIKTS